MTHLIKICTDIEKIPESEPDDKAPTAGLLSKQAVPVHVERKLFDTYYNGCCNETFWPLFHSMPDRAIFRDDTWAVRLSFLSDQTDFNFLDFSLFYRVRKPKEKDALLEKLSF